VRWLVQKEARSPDYQRDWQKRKRGVEASGWYFQFKNEFYPDVDDSAAVLMSLKLAAMPGDADTEASIRRGIDWVLSLQCSNGGWAAFDVDVDHEILTKIPFADHNAMLDPACADITGRVLEMLGYCPQLLAEKRVRDAVDRALKFLAGEQDAAGCWYGRWGVNYIYGTCHVLKGLSGVGFDPQSPMVRRAVEWLKSCQNADGGWGETCGSYDDPSLKGRGQSTPSQSAWALHGLIAAGEASRPEVERGVRYLLSTQRGDGFWPEDLFTGTGFPRVFYLKYHLYSQYFPLCALATYRRATAGARAAGAEVVAGTRQRQGAASDNGTHASEPQPESAGGGAGLATPMLPRYAARETGARGRSSGVASRESAGR
jgi:squalene-hopene/tetraprenyl-beta-curcumene cyclase